MSYLLLQNGSARVTASQGHPTSERSYLAWNFRKPEPSKSKHPMKIAAVLVLSLALVPVAFVASSAVLESSAQACGMSIRMDPTPQRPSPVQDLSKSGFDWLLSQRGVPHGVSVGG